MGGTPPFLEGMRPAHGKLYAQPIARPVFKDRPSRRRSAAIRTHNYDGVARAAGKFADTGQGSVREMQSRGFWLRSTCRNCCDVNGGTDEKKSADTALLIGALSVALRQHVSKVPRAVDPAWRDVRTMTILLVRPERKSLNILPVLPAS